MLVSGLKGQVSQAYRIPSYLPPRHGNADPNVELDKRWLLIFDNLEDARLLETYIPVNFKGGSVMITTQHAHILPITNDFPKLELQPLSEESGSALYFKILGRGTKDEEEDDIAHEIFTWVGGLPLAIVTVAGYQECSSFLDGRVIQKSSEDITDLGKLWHRNCTQL